MRINVNDFDPTWLTDLAAAIRQGNTAEAEYLLDRIAAEVDGWPDLVGVGRYRSASRRAA